MKVVYKAYIVLIITTLLAMLSFYMTEYYWRHPVGTGLGWFSTAIGWYYFGVEHGYYLNRRNPNTNT